ncbi:MAG: mechanosensitive ion channel family protein [Actinobacteria bacterium]|nr:mechanosensitive ion channel family protein [Actinomycetota bacterium]
MAPATAWRRELNEEPGAWEQIVQSFENMADAVFRTAPRFALALLVFALFVIVGRIVRRVLRPRLERVRTLSFGRVFSTLAYVGIVVLGLVVSLPIALPSVSIGAMLGGLGLMGVAAGFAFQDILSNMLSGILLIFRQPFVAGDQIEVTGIAGTVQEITIRETRIHTFDGRIVYVPNKDVYTNAIEVQTGQEHVMTSLLVGVDYDSDLALARGTALEALAATEGVRKVPAPQAFYTDFTASAIELDLRYWTGSREAEIRRVRDRVVETVKAAFDAAGIDIPFDIVTLDASEALERVVRRGG